MEIVMPSFRFNATVAAIVLLSTGSAFAQEKVLNLYSARHYQTDEALYSKFTEKTGIKINRIEADDSALLERLKNEGKNSPADVVLMVDAARLRRCASMIWLAKPRSSPGTHPR